MASANAEGAAARGVEVVEEPLPAEAESAPSPAEGAIERLLEHVPLEAPALERGVEIAPALRMARVVSMNGDGAQIAWRRHAAPIQAELDDGVDREVIERALTNGDLVLVEIDPEIGPVVMGVVQRRIPERLELRGETVVIEADREVLLRAGRAAARLREDGDVEIVGSRILTMSRGLFRIVGRVLRLN
jgi:hypothetical protein